MGTGDPVEEYRGRHLKTTEPASALIRGGPTMSQAVSIQVTRSYDVRRNFTGLGVIRPSTLSNIGALADDFKSFFIPARKEEPFARWASADSLLIRPREALNPPVRDKPH